MTFIELAKERRRRELRRGKRLTMDEAKAAVAREILEAYADAKEALSDARDLRRFRAVRYTAEGWQYGAAAIEAALKFVEG